MEESLGKEKICNLKSELFLSEDLNVKELTKPNSL